MHVYHHHGSREAICMSPALWIRWASGFQERKPPLSLLGVSCCQTLGVSVEFPLVDLWLAVGEVLWDVVGICCLPSLEEVCPAGSLPGSRKLIHVSQARDFLHLPMASKRSSDGSHTCFSLTRGTVLPKTRGCVGQPLMYKFYN